MPKLRVTTPGARLPLPLSHINPAHLTNVGVNTHVGIDVHIADPVIHFPMPALPQLTDVNAPAPADNDSLTYDLATNTWIPEARLLIYTRAATRIVAANDSLDTVNADYFCDGVADEVQINAAIDALPATGGRVLLMDGTYNIDASIVIDVDNTALVGQGKSTNILTDDVIRMVEIGVNLEGILIANLCFDGPNIAGTYGIYNISADHIIIRGCWFYNMREGIRDQGGNWNIVAGCSFKNGYYGVYLDQVYYDSVSNCVFNNLGRGVQIASNRTNTVSACAFHSCNNGVRLDYECNSVTGCVGRDNSQLVAVTRDYNSVVGCTSYSSDGLIAATAADYCSFVGNTCYQGSDYLIDLQTCHGNTITGNTGYDLGGSYGIRLLASNYNTVTGNTITKADRDGIQITTGNHNIISGNNIHDCSEDTNDTYASILLTGTTTYNVVTGNRCSANAANKHKYGIRENAVADDWNLIHGNICTDAVTANISSQGPNSQVLDNIAP